MRYQYILLLAISVSAVSSCTINPANEKLPDIVVCLGDDHGVYHSTPYGSKMVQTPNMQFLADKSEVPIEEVEKAKRILAYAKKMYEEEVAKK